jgi:hypothetical protein
MAERIVGNRQNLREHSLQVSDLDPCWLVIGWGIHK